MIDLYVSRKRPTSFLFPALFFAILGFSAACLAQAGRGEPYRQREEMLEREIRQILTSERVLSRKAFLDYGAIFRFTLSKFDSFEDDRRLSRTYRDYDIRPWFSLNVNDVHSFYGRLRFDVIDFNSGQAPEGTDGVSGPDVDQLFYTLQLDRFVERRYSTILPGPTRLTLGRQFFNVGQGIVYSEVNDGILLSTTLGNWDLNLFGSRTIGGEDNVDRSTNLEGNERYFYGAELAYTGIVGHRQYVYFVGQEDQSGGPTPVLRADGTNIKQAFDYDSQYLGLGLSGQLFRNFGYRAEGIWERGRSEPDRTLGNLAQALNTGHRDMIDAYAFDIGLDWYIDAKSRPRISLDYALASGDEDRENVTDTIEGNRPGTKDRNFLYFGFMDSGFSFAPRFSNISFIRIDGSFRPFYDTRHFDKMETGLTYYYYQKHQREGGVSDSQANKAHRTLGSEIDVYMNWKALSDLSHSLRYGVFLPGSAFSDKTARHYYLCSITYSF